ncbi:MAG: reverse transcriptase domain-containing protein [Parcubacteria group bacterium]
MDKRHRNFVCRGGINSRSSYCLFDEVCSFDNLLSAWKEFRRGKRRKRDVREFEFSLEDNLFRLYCELRAKTYQHSKYTPFYITDPKLRHIHKACVRDRIVHQALFRVLYLIFDRDFIFDSYSCRIGKGTHRAVRRLKQFCNKISGNDSENVFALKCDIKKYFDSINHCILLEIIKRRVKCPDTMKLIHAILSSFGEEEGKGLPLGNVTSQLFANIYMNEFDQFAKHILKARYYIRYCDDFIILTDNKEEIQRLIQEIHRFLQKRLKLLLHEDKIIVRSFRQGIDFLGYIVRPHCITLRTKTKKRILSKLKNDNKASYFGVLRHCNGYKVYGDMLGLLEKQSKTCYKV